MIIGVLTQGTSAQKPATKANLDSWISGIKTPNTWTLDSVAPQEPLQALLLSPHDEFVLIDLKTMKILEFITGNVKAALAALYAALDQPQ